MTMPYSLVLIAFAFTLEASTDAMSELAPRALEEPILVEDLTTAQAPGLVPVTGPLGSLELRRAIVVDTIAPSSPSINDLWIDASSAGNYRTCIYTGAGWIETDGSGASCGAVEQRTLQVTIAGSGSGSVFSLPGGISCGEDCQHPFTLGEAVQLYAVPGPDSLFFGWSGCSSETAAAIAVLMEENAVCTADFATSIGIPAADWSPGYTLYYDFETLYPAGAATAAQLVPNLGTAGASCDLRQYGANLPPALSPTAQQGTASLRLASVGSGINQRLGVRLVSDPVNGSCDIARTGNPGADYGSFTYTARFLPYPNTEAGATLSRVSEVANGGPGGWAFEWQESGVIVARGFQGNTASALASPSLCPAGAFCVVTLSFDDALDTFCLYVNGQLASCTALATITEPGTGSLSYFRFGHSTNSAKLDGLVDEAGLRLGVAYSAADICRVCSCGIDGALCSCDPQQTQLYAAGGGKGLNAPQCGNCALPACDRSAP